MRQKRTVDELVGLNTAVHMFSDVKCSSVGTRGHRSALVRENVSPRLCSFVVEPDPCADETDGPARSSH